MVGMKQTPENAVKAGVRRYLKFKGWLAASNPQGLGCKAGRPDLQALKKGVTIYIECKAPKGRVSNKQKLYHEELMQHGGIVVVCWSIDEFMNDLDKIEERLWPGQNSKRLV